MNDVSGIDNETKFVNYLNGKVISDLNPMFRNFIDEIFSYPNDNLIIRCMKNKYKQKSDIFIKINDVIKGFSIKKGAKNSVHVERIIDFIHFLIENHVDREIVIEYLKYHYADGTTNGKGLNRLSVEDYKKSNQDKIDKINAVLNNENILRKAITRFVTKGKNSNYDISAIIYGEVEDFIWITKEDIFNVILLKKDDYSSAVHFGSLVCQPKNRCLNYNPRYEQDRFCIQIKWYSLFDDIIDNMNNKCIKRDYA